MSIKLWIKNCLFETHQIIKGIRNYLKPCFVLAMVASLLLPIANAENFIIGVEDVPYYPLYEFNTDEPSYSRDLLDTFAQSSGHTFSYLPLPIKRFDRWLIENDIDFKYPDNVRWNSTNSLQGKLIYSAPTITLMSGTLVLASRIDEPRSFFKNMGTILGFYPSLWINEIATKQIKLHENPSTKVLIRQVLNGQLNGINIDPSVIYHQLKELGFLGNELVVNRNMMSEVYHFHLSTMRHPALIQQFNGFLSNNPQLLIDLRKKYKIFDVSNFEIVP